MSHLRSGLWTGTAVNSENQNSQQVTVEIEVAPDGSLQGRFIDDRQAQASSTQPNIHGQSSTFGAVSFNYRVDSARHVLFTGRFELPDDKHGVMWGSIILVYGSDRREEGTASLQFVHTVKRVVVFDHVWG